MIRTFQDLLAWQLSQELRDEITALDDAGTFAVDAKLREQILDSTASAPRNIAEGYGRRGAREFAFFLRVARGSLMETQQHLLDASRRRLIEQRLHQRLTNLARAATRVTSGLERRKRQEADDEDKRRRASKRRPQPKD